MTHDWPDLSTRRDTPSIVPTLLREYGTATRRMVEHYLATDRPAPYLHDLLTDYPRRGGKMMRPGICIANARAFGASLEDALYSAAAVELLHNALLIHDDIQDESEVRRGLPTLHVMHGVPLAINAGDAMLLLAMRPLLDNVRTLGSHVAMRILDVTTAMARETAEGQALELGWRDGNRTDVGEADYLTMVLKKTSWMATIWPAQIGLLIGSHGMADPANVVRFGFFLGAAFQIQDDLLNLVADRAYGKELNGDLFEAKRTLMLIHARETCTEEERAVLDEFLTLQRRDRTQDKVRWLAELMDRQGSIDYARTVAMGLAGAAEHEFDRAYGHLPASPDKEFLAGLIPWVFERT